MQKFTEMFSKPGDLSFLMASKANIFADQICFAKKIFDHKYFQISIDLLYLITFLIPCMRRIVSIASSTSKTSIASTPNAAENTL